MNTTEKGQKRNRKKIPFLPPPSFHFPVSLTSFLLTHPTALPRECPQVLGCPVYDIAGLEIVVEYLGRGKDETIGDSGEDGPDHGRPYKDPEMEVGAINGGRANGTSRIDAAAVNGDESDVAKEHDKADLEGDQGQHVWVLDRTGCVRTEQDSQHQEHAAYHLSKKCLPRSDRHNVIPDIQHLQRVHPALAQLKGLRADHLGHGRPSDGTNNLRRYVKNSTRSRHAPRQGQAQRDGRIDVPTTDGIERVHQDCDHEAGHDTNAEDLLPVVGSRQAAQDQKEEEERRRPPLGNDRLRESRVAHLCQKVLLVIVKGLELAGRGGGLETWGVGLLGGLGGHGVHFQVDGGHEARSGGVSGVSHD